MEWDELWRGVRVWTVDAEGRERRIERAAIAWRHDRIAFVGAESELADSAEDLARRVRRFDGAWVTPGLIDAHTHLVFAGQRAGEFESRLRGASYEEIARAGGGIWSTVQATRASDEGALFAQSAKRAQELIADGVTTVEIKSGYGLDYASERKMLRVARRLGRELPISVVTSFLGLHALPPGVPRETYVREVAEDWLPRLADEGLVDAVDAYCEGVAFNAAECGKLFRQARKLGLPVRVHADQLSNTGGATLAARYQALSADHLEYTDTAGVAALAAAGTVAVLLPTAYYTLRERTVPPVAALRKAGVPLAVASDQNPGTAPIRSLRVAMNQAAVLFGLSPNEVLTGVTAHAARALGLRDRGRLLVGQRADLVAWDIQEPAELTYWIGGALCLARVQAGGA